MEKSLFLEEARKGMPLYSTLSCMEIERKVVQRRKAYLRG